MVFSSQAFKAPSLTAKPKLGKTTVSSSVFRGTAKVAGSGATKVPRGMGYGSIHRGPSVDPKYLEKPKTPIEQTLVETNNILVEIQKQLSLDFAYRIAKEQEQTARIRQAADKADRAKAESGAEGTKKVGSALGRIADKVLAPTKSIFDKILGFLGSVLTGFIVNKGLEWLRDNESTVKSVFDFIGKNYKLILGIIGGVLIGRVVYKIVKLFRALRGVARFLTGRGGRTAAAASGGRGGLFRNAAGQRRGRVNVTRTTETRTLSRRSRLGGFTKYDQTVDVIKREKGILNKALQGVEVSAKKFSRNIIKSLGMGPGQKTLQKSLLKLARPILKRIPFVGALLDFALSVALGEDPGRAAFGAIGAGLLGAVGTFLGGPLGAFIGGFAGDFAGRKLYDLFFGNKSKDPAAEEGMNRGGTVPGGGPDRDSVSVMLTPGEKVVSRKSSRMFGPFLDDIIYDGARLYKGMAKSLEEQEDTNKKLIETNKEFKLALSMLTARQFADKNPLLKSTPTPTPPSPQKSNITPTPSSSAAKVNTKLDKKEGKITTLPMIPTSRSQTPSSAQTAKPAGGDSIQTYDAEDPDNFYVEFIKRQFGIFGV